MFFVQISFQPVAENKKGTRALHGSVNTRMWLPRYLNMGSVWVREGQMGQQQDFIRFGGLPTFSSGA